MNGINLGAVFPLEDEELYPSSDGQPMAETQVHIILMLNLYGLLRNYFRKKKDIYVAANMFLYFREGHPEARTAPDIMVIKGVDGRKTRRSFKTWIEQAVPCFVLELTSKKTAKEDQVKKKQLYQELGIHEYFLFDPLHDYLPRQLLGYRLANGIYQALEAEEMGTLDSVELGLRLQPEKARLVVVDGRTAKRLLDPDEAMQSLDEAQAKAAHMQDALEQERRKNAELSETLKRLKAKKK
jgi:Uma2 family endonuclease